MKKIKILTVTNMWPNERHSYYGIFVKEQTEVLSQKNSDFKITVYFINGLKSKLNYIKSFFQINYLIIKNNYDIIHIHFGLSGLFLLFKPFFFKTPVLTTFHSADIDPAKANKLNILISRFVARRSNVVFYLSDNMLNVLADIDVEKIYLPCGIDINLFQDKRNQFLNSKLIIAFPSNKERTEKNHVLFVEILDFLKKNYEYEIEVIEIHNKTRVEVMEDLNKIDLLLMTSTCEGSPQIIKEAMACNTPIISTNVGDVKYLLEGVQNCHVIDDFNCDNFVQTILTFFPPNNWIRKNSTGRLKLYELKLDNYSIAERLNLEYKKLLN